MKKIILLPLILLIFVIKLSAQSSTTESTMLWRISGKGIKTSYLFGTMHVRDARAFDFPDSVLAAFGKCESFATEVHPDSMSKMMFANFEKSISKRMSFDTDDFFEKAIGHDRYYKLDNRLQQESGISLNQIKNKNPRLIRSLLSETENELNAKPVFLDMFLFDMAGGENKSIYGLESLEGTEKTLSALRMSREQRYEMEVDAVDKIRSMDNLIDYYHDNNLQAVLELFSDTSKFGVEYRKMLLDERNVIMANSIDTIVRKGSCFVAVGCGHLPGQYGLITLLRAMGYVVEPVVSPRNGLASEYPYKSKELKWQSMNDEVSGYSIDYPGNPFPVKVPFTESDMYCYSDLGKGSVFFSYGIFASSEFANASNKKLYKRLIDKMVKERGGKLLQQKNIVIEGKDALQLKIETRGLPYEVVMVRNDRMVYLLLAHIPNERSRDEVFQRFVSSFRFKAVANKDYLTFTSKDDAFSADFPGTPVKRDMNVNAMKMRLYIANDTKTNVNYVFQCLDMSAGTYNNNDDQILTNVGDNVLRSLGNLKTLSDERKLIQGYTAREIDAQGKDARYRFVSITRLNRVYSAIVTYLPQNKEQVDAFVQSIKFLDYTAPDYKKVELVKDFVWVSLPTDVLADTTEFNADGTENELYWSTVDAHSSAMYQVNYRKYSSLYSASDSAFKANLKEMFVEESDLLIDEHEEAIEKGKKIEFTYDIANTHVEKKIVHILKGNVLFSMVMYYDPEQKKSSTLSDFFGSALFNEKMVEGDVFADKKEALKKELRKPTQSTSVLVDAINATEWKNEDIDFLISVLPVVYADDSNAYYSVKSVLYRALKDLDKEKVSQRLKKLYPTLDNKSKVNALEYLGWCRNKESMDFIANAVLNKTVRFEKAYNFGSVVSSASDSAALVKDFYLKIIPAVSDTNVCRGLWFYLSDAMDSAWFTANDFTAHASLFQKRFLEDLQEMKTGKLTNPDFYLDYWFLYAIDFMYDAQLNTAEIDDQLRDCVALFDSEELNYHVVLNFLLNNKTVDAAVKEKVFKNVSYQFSLFSKLLARNKLDLLPAAYRDSILLTKSELISYLLDYEEFYPDEVEFVVKKTINHEGKKVEVYLFKVYSSYEGEKECYYAVSGGYIPGKFTGKQLAPLTTMNWKTMEEVKGMKVDEIIEDLVHPKLEEEGF